MDTLDPCSDSDINNDVSSLYVEIIDKNRLHCKCTICGWTLSTWNPLELSSWRRLEITQANHNFEWDYKLSFTLIFIKEGYHIRKYNRYIDDPTVPEYLNQQSLTVASVQLNLKQWWQQSRVCLIKEKHLYKRQKKLYAITQMVKHCLKYKTILLIADRQIRKTNKL